MLNVVVCSGEHTAGTTGLIAYGNNLTIIKDIITAFRHQDLNQQFDNISAGITTKDNIWEVNTEKEYHESK